ncbi:type III PLP-dependent enzyme domain-containing protein [Hymenobacter jeollabukensis]|uniref:Diaminopimelate decarboxylase n=1 Tax=Hymenobacter jeollabukensis TaxID=2025313 RepID=A0A5R8WX62_9BACT|nr:diaminopimelate decarboxylase [Hymenobacter jeollabukensis]TLM96949.1 diaminopimelate decarboxylase [Hymenobacter jeollabukensis]
MKQRYERPLIKKLSAGPLNKFGARTEAQPVPDIDGAPVKELLRAFGSPLFVLSEKQLRRNYQLAVRAFRTRYPRVQFAWSYKTNYLNAVCRVFHQEGAWAEVVSGFEYEKALLNGVPGPQIIFNGPGKSRAELQRACELDSVIHLDHFDELYELLDLAASLPRRPRVAVRVNLDAGVYPQWDRFGFNLENGQAWNAIGRIVGSGRLELVGLHCHLGTYLLTTKPYGVAAQKLADLAWSCRTQLNTPIQYLDLGGGFPSTNTLKGAYLPGTDTAPGIDEFAEVIADTLQRAGFRQDELPLLILEAGRLLVDDAGYLLGTVLATKRLADGRRATILDFGVNVLFTSFWYDHKISPAGDFSQHTEDTVLFGPLCMNIDVLRDSVNLPLLNRGDQVVVHKVGAYNMTQWMQFITLRPAVVLLDEQGRPHRIRQAETLDYLQQLEEVPAHLGPHPPAPSPKERGSQPSATTTPG